MGPLNATMDPPYSACFWSHSQNCHVREWKLKYNFLWALAMEIILSSIAHFCYLHDPGCFFFSEAFSTCHPFNFPYVHNYLLQGIYNWHSFRSCVIVHDITYLRLHAPPNPWHVDFSNVIYRYSTVYASCLFTKMGYCICSVSGSKCHYSTDCQPRCSSWQWGNWNCIDSLYPWQPGQFHWEQYGYSIDFR